MVNAGHQPKIFEGPCGIKQLRRGAPDQSRLVQRRRTSEVLAEIETTVIETSRQTLSVLRRHSSLDTSRSTLWRALHEDLQVRCFKPVTCCSAWARSPWQTAFEALGPDACGVFGREVLPLEFRRTEPKQSDLGGWSPREARTKGRSRSQSVHQRAQPAQPSSDGQAGADCHTFWHVESMFTQRHIMPMPLSCLKKHIFQLDPPEKH